MGPRLAMDEEEQKLHVKQKSSSTNGDEEEEGEGKATRRSSSDLADEEVEGDMEELHHPMGVVKTPPFQFGNYTRYLIMFLTTLCLSLAMSNALALNFTVICMYKSKEDGDEEAGIGGNFTDTAEFSRGEDAALRTSAFAPSSPPAPMFNSAEQALLFSAVPVGTLLGTLPITPLTSHFGMRRTFTIYGLVSAAATLLTPLAARLDLSLLLIMRVLQGVAVSICFPASGSITADWAPLRSAGTFIALLSCHIQFGPILTMPLAGELCESSWGWPAVYYLQAVLTALFFLAFFAFYRDSPRKHRNVSRAELCKIERDKPPLDAGPERHQVPYGAMLRDPAVWGVFLCSMGSTFGFHVFMQYGPIYLNQTIKFDITRTGFAMALPQLLSALTKFIVGPSSDHMTFVSERSRVLLFASVSQFLMAFCFCCLALLPADSPPLLLQGFFTAVTVVSGLNCAGVGKSTQLISRQFAHVVTSFSVFVCSITIITIPMLVSALAPDNRPEQWSRIFLIVAFVVILCVLFFDCTAEASPRPWTFSKRPRTIQGNGEAGKKSSPLLASIVPQAVDEPLKQQPLPNV